VRWPDSPRRLRALGRALLRLPAFYESFLYLVFHWIVLAGLLEHFSPATRALLLRPRASSRRDVTTATLATKAGVPFLWTLPAAALVAAVFGIALGAVVFRLPRLRGELFACSRSRDFRARDDCAQYPIDGGPGLS